MTTAQETFQGMAFRLGRGRDAMQAPAGAAAGPTSGTAKPSVDMGFARLVAICCSLLVVFTGLVLGAVWLIGEELARAGHTADTGTREIAVGNDVLAVPANLIRFRTQRGAPSTERLDLYLLWPAMEGYSETNATAFNAGTVNPALIFLTIEPRRMSLDMSGRLDAIYAKFFAGPAVPAGHGLLRRPLDAAGGFVDEELWYEASSPYPYAARCMRGADGAAAGYCLRDIHMGRDITVTYRFHASLIAEWMAIEAAVRASVNRMLYR